MDLATAPKNPLPTTKNFRRRTVFQGSFYFAYLHCSGLPRAFAVLFTICVLFPFSSFFFLSNAFTQELSPTPSIPKGLVEYQIDPEHSTIQFSVRHLGISVVRGLFPTFKGSFTFPDTPADGALLPSARAEVTIDAGAISSRVPKRDKHLRSPDFLSTTKFPEIRFSTTAIEGSSPENFQVVGKLSIRGIEKEVRLDVQGGSRAQDPWGNERIGFSARTTIDRFDYGVKWNQLLESGAPVVGSEIEIELLIEGVKGIAPGKGAGHQTPAPSP